jgi:hypothetical protein
MQDEVSAGYKRDSAQIKMEGSAAATREPSIVSITCCLEVFVQSVMLSFFLFLFAFFLLCHYLLPPYGIQKTGLLIMASDLAATINRIVKDADKRSYSFYRPYI